jgi:muramoyltetrapeptide carboxypeptidase
MASTPLEERHDLRAPARTKPRRLPAGGVIAIPSPASPVLDQRSLVAARSWLEELGYEARFTQHANSRWGYAAGKPEARARDLEQAFADPEIDAVLCLNGGHAAAMVLRHLDYELIAANPKPFVGFSDITVLHAALGAETGLVTFWGPMFGQLGDAAPFTRNGLLRALTSAEPLGVVDPSGPPARTIVPGVAVGELVGGTTQVLSSILGTPWEIDTRGKILLLEDVGEEPCRVHRFLVHMLNAGKLDECAGICLAEFTNCEPQTAGSLWHGPSLTLDEVFEHVFAPLGIPTIYGLPLGHGQLLATVPLGVQARLDATAGRLELLEAGVSSPAGQRPGGVESDRSPR